MSKAASSSSMLSNVLLFTDHLTGRRVSLALVADGKLQSPAQLRAQIKRPLELMKAAAWFFARQSPLYMHRRQESLPPVAHLLAECSPCVPVRFMFACVATACQRLATASVEIHLTCSTMWGFAKCVMERVTRGRVKKVQVRLQRRTCCAVRFACRASACVRCVFDACCSKR
jgi:hypothetical protein